MSTVLVCPLLVLVVVFFLFAKSRPLVHIELFFPFCESRPLVHIELFFPFCQIPIPYPSFIKLPSSNPL